MENMKQIRYMITSLVALLMWSCSAEDVSVNTQPSGVVDNGDGTLTLTVSLDVPGMEIASSRVMGKTPEYKDLKLYLLEFNLNGQEPLSNFLTNVYQAENETSAGDEVQFSVKLKKTEDPKVLHLIAVPRDVDLSIENQYGSEGSLIPELTTANGQDAYWQRVEFPKGYGTQGTDGTWTPGTDLNNKLARVPMIRNFAQISVQNKAQDFTLTGFAVVNVPQTGTVAPWNSNDMRFPAYLDGNNGQKKYDEMDYSGQQVNVASLDRTVSFVEAGSSKYIYERPYSSVYPTQVLIRGTYAGVETYYKIDLGRTDANGIFEHYNLLRNFHYQIKINEVTAAGYTDAQSALNGVVYNNISFDVLTAKMLNISNGKDMLWVNFTTKVITRADDRTFLFAYRYKSDITSSEGGTLQNELKTIGLEAGDVIASVNELQTPPEGQPADWKYYEITTHTPTAERKMQSFVVTNPETGLARTINLVLRVPWEIVRNRVFAGNYNLPDEFPDQLQGGGDYENKVSDAEKKPLTIFFVLPDDLPEAIFPLTFELEADRQNIENNPIGTLVVASGPSLFPNITGERIKYLKTITWTDYNTETTTENYTGVVVSDQRDPSGATKIRRVRCRFRTITSLANLGVTTSTTTRVRIHNPYFRCQSDYNAADNPNADTQVTFVRTKGQTLEKAPDNAVKTQ